MKAHKFRATLFGFPLFRAGWQSPTMLPAVLSSRRLRLPIRLKANDGGIRPELQEMLRFVRTHLHNPSYVSGSEGVAGRFSEGIFTFDWNRFPANA
jgi:hypothetical protein